MDDPKILIIDDEIKKDYAAPLKGSLESMIRSLGHEPLFAQRGDEGLNVIQNDRSIKLVILDNEFIGQPMQGGEILKQIRAINDALPVVMFSNLEKSEIKRPVDPDQKEVLPTSKTARRLGATAYIQKGDFSSNPNKVKNIINSILSKKEYFIELASIENEKSLNIFDSENNMILKKPFSFAGLKDEWEADGHAHNRDHLVFKIIEALCRGKEEVSLRSIFPHYSSSTNDVYESEVDKLCKLMKNQPVKSSDKSHWSSLIDKFRKDQFKTENLEDFLYKYNMSDILNRVRNLDTTTDKDVKVNIDVNKAINEFNSRISTLSDGKIQKLIEGRGAGRVTGQEGGNNAFHLCEGIKYKPLNIPATESDRRDSGNAYVTQAQFDSLKRDFESFKKEVMAKLKK